MTVRVIITNWSTNSISINFVTGTENIQNSKDTSQSNETASEEIDGVEGVEKQTEIINSKETTIDTGENSGVTEGTDRSQSIAKIKEIENFQTLEGELLS